MFALLLVSSPRKPKIIIDGLTYLRVETAYELPNVGPLNVLIPSDRLEMDQ